MCSHLMLSKVVNFSKNMAQFINVQSFNVIKSGKFKFFFFNEQGPIRDVQTVANDF